MANKKLTDLTELITPADGDFLYIVDVSDTTESPQGTSKKIRKDKVDSGASKENLANKQNSLAIDGTGTKYPTVDAVNAVLPTTYSKVVYVNSTSPTTATIFDTENPPVTNNNALKNDTANLYIGTDASTWVYLTGTGYVTKTVSSATSNFNTFGTSVDAGNSKTSHITRSGAMTLTGPLNILNLKIATTPTTSAGSYDILTRNSSTTALEKKLVNDFVQITGTQTISGRKNLTSDNTTAGGITIISSRTTNTGGTQDAAALVISNTGTNAIITETGNGDGILTKSFGTGSSITAQTFSTGAGLTLRNQGGTGDLLSAELGKVTINSAGKLSTTEVATTGNNVPNKTYVDAKITQTITNGVTDKSPSEDAVFDALTLKANDGDVLHKTGDETKTGVLTLVSDAIINGMKIGRGFGSISGNTVLGDNSGRAFTTGSQNTFTGFNVGQNDTTGSQNTFTGFNSGVANTTGSSNTFMGTNTGLANTIGSGNLFLGQGSGQNNVSGGNNVAIGQNSGRYIADKTTSVTILSNSVMLGYRTSPLANTQTNQTVIGYDATGLGSNTTVIGNSSTVQTWLGGKVTIGTTTDDGIVGNKLQVNGNITSNVATLSNQVVVKSQLDAIRPYKVYTAILTQIGTDAPTAIVLENTIGSIVWSRTIAGGYFATLTGAFTTDKTTVLITNGSSNGTYIHGASVSTSNVNVITSSDSQIDRATIEIRVYN